MILMDLESNLTELKFMSKAIQLDLLQGKLEWEDNRVQYFIPAALYFTDFDWLKLIAEHNLIEEDSKIVINFLEQVEALSDVNSQRLNDDVEDKLNKLFKE